MEVKRGYRKWRDENGKLHKEPYVEKAEMLDLGEDDGEEEELSDDNGLL